MTEWLVRRFVKNYQDVENPRVRTAYGLFASIVGIVCNLLLSLGKGLVGLASGSVAIVADAVNNLSDASSNIISLLGFKLASRPADHEHPYGHGRMEYLAGLTVAVLVLVVGVELVKSSIDEILHPKAVDFTWVAVAVLVGSILVKVWMALFNYRIGKRIDSVTLKATAADSRNDAITTGAVLAALLVDHCTALSLDGWAGLAVGGFIVVSSIGLIRDAVEPLLGAAPDPKQVRHIHDKIMGYPGVLGTHDLMIHDYGPGRQFASAHVEMAAEQDVLEAHDVIDTIEQDFLTNDGLVMTIHYDPIVTSDERVNTLRSWMDEVVRGIDPRLSVHDLRAAPGPTHTNVIFDCVKPCEVPLSDDELRAEIRRRVGAVHPEYVCKVTVDNDYVSAEG